MRTRPTRGTRAAWAALLALGLLVCPPSAAAAGCPELPSSAMFAAWGDDSAYSLAPGGNFETSDGWAQTGPPSLAGPNNPFYPSGPGRFSGGLRRTAAITSPPLCVTGDQPSLRFVARALDPTSRLVLELLWTDHGVAKVDVIEEHQADLYRQWGPSKRVPLGSALPTGSGEVHQVRLRFKLKDGAGHWLVDDVSVDPIRRG